MILRTINHIHNVHLRTKLIMGFSAIIILLFLIAFIAFSTFRISSQGLDVYRQSTKSSDIIEKIQEKLLRTRIVGDGYLETGDNKAVKDFEQLCLEFEDLIRQGLEMAQNPEQKAQIHSIQELMNQYNQRFHEITGIMDQVKALTQDKMEPTGTKITSTLTNLSRNAQARGNASGSFYAGIALKDLLATRISLAKFLFNRKQADADTIQQQLQRLEGDLILIKLKLTTPTQKQTFSRLEKLTQEYTNDFQTLAPLVIEIEKKWIEIRNTENLITGQGSALAQKFSNIQSSVGTRIEKSNHNSVILLSIVSIFALVLIIAVMGRILSSVLRQLGGDPSEMVEIADQITQGNLAIKFSQEPPHTRGIYKNMYEMVEKLSRMFREILQGAVSLNESSTDLSRLSVRMRSGAEETAESSFHVAHASEEMTTTMHTLAAAAEQTTANLQLIAAASSEMAATIANIASHTAKGSDTTTQAVEKAREVSGKVGELSLAAEKINKVTETISAISEQTNLLALNATIEAARAGEAGKGFAVVAGEIKDLAQQTAEATNEISRRVQGIQESTSQSVDAINLIVEMINEINEIVISVSTAIEEQSATTQEISINVNQAAAGSQESAEGISQISAVAGEVSADIARVSQTAEEVKTGSGRIAHRAEKLSSLAQDLDTMMKQFTL